MGIFIIFVIIVGALIFYANLTRNKQIEQAQKDEEERKARKAKEQREHEELIANANRQMQLMEVLRQAKLVGDKETADDVLNGTYDKELPDKRDDGAYMSIYDNLRIFKIAGMKYRGDLSAYIGDFNGVLVPEPNNEYDPFAIMVKCEDGKHVGYIKEDQTEMVRWMVGAEQPIGEETPTIFKPYRINGIIKEITDEMDGHKFYDGCVYIKKQE